MQSKNPVAKKPTSSLTVVIEDSRYANLVITWKQNSRTLMLCRKGGPDGNAIILKKTSIKGSEVTLPIAQAQAERWFDSMDIFEQEPDVKPEDEWSDE